MESVLSLKMLALVLLVSSMNEGRIVSKCELKTYLEAAQFQVIKAMGNSMTVEHLIARLVCNVENTSAFNTSLVTGIQINLEDLRPPFQSRPPPKEPEEPTAKEEDDEKMKEEQIIPVQPQKRPKGRPERSIPVDKVISSAVQGEKEHFWMWQRDIFPKKPPAESSGSSSEESSEEHGSGDSSEEELDDVISQNLFGIFQLSDRVACDSGSNRTLNLCGLECSDHKRRYFDKFLSGKWGSTFFKISSFVLCRRKQVMQVWNDKRMTLVDDDITEDVICLKTLVERRGKFSGFSPKKRFYAKMMAMLSVKECRSIIPSEYFAECSGKISTPPTSHFSVFQKPLFK